MADTYQEALKAKSIIRLRELMKALPPFLSEFFRGLADQTSIRTRIGYAYDLKIFFTYLSEECIRFQEKEPTDFTVEDLSLLTSDDIEEFMEYLSYYVRVADGDSVEWQNDALGKSRKLAAVRTMFKYFYRKKKLPANPSELVGFPKLHEKPITTLEVDEIARLLDEVESGEHLKGHQKRFHEITKTRDVALVTLLLGTGMRVSECIGLDIQHLDFTVNGAKVTRKGGDEMILYFGTEVEEALQDYLKVRKVMNPQAGHENALFLSIQNRRITDRAVQNLVKKYAQLVTTLKNISPHKLRSTFGTQLYRETGDIYLVANVLGHADVNTTRKHYAKMEDEYRRRAANAIRLREQ